MPNAITAKVEGFDELRRAMKALDGDLREKHLSNAVGAGALVIQKAAKEKAPRRTGKIAKAIYRKRMQGGAAGVAEWIVGVRSGKKFAARTLKSKTGKQFQTRDLDAYYWRWVEFGHVAAGPGGRLTGGSRVKQSKRDARRTAGQFVAARPFMRPAYEQRKGDAVDAIRARLARDLAKAIPGFTPS